MNKKELRSLYLEKRITLADELFLLAQHKILQHFLEIDLDTVRSIHTFLPIIEKNEFNTFLLIDWLMEHHPLIKIVVPRTDFKNNTLEHFEYDPVLELEKNQYGILEPVMGHRSEPKDIDMVLVPLLAFDKNGYRVGYGKGLYDKFLSECSPDTQKIGISLFEPVDIITDINDWDVKLDACVCPQRIYRF